MSQRGLAVHLKTSITNPKIRGPNEADSTMKGASKLHTKFQWSERPASRTGLKGQSPLSVMYQDRLARASRSQLGPPRKVRLRPSHLPRKEDRPKLKLAFLPLKSSSTLPGRTTLLEQRQWEDKNVAFSVPVTLDDLGSNMLTLPTRPRRAENPTGGFLPEDGRTCWTTFSC